MLEIEIFFEFGDVIWIRAGFCQSINLPMGILKRWCTCGCTVINSNIVGKIKRTTYQEAGDISPKNVHKRKLAEILLISSDRSWSKNFWKATDTSVNSAGRADLISEYRRSSNGGQVIKSWEHVPHKIFSSFFSAILCKLATKRRWRQERQPWKFRRCSRDSPRPIISSDADISCSQCILTAR